jgi:hypothetical protein
MNADKKEFLFGFIGVHLRSPAANNVFLRAQPKNVSATDLQDATRILYLSVSIRG